MQIYTENQDISKLLNGVLSLDKTSRIEFVKSILSSLDEGNAMDDDYFLSEKEQEEIDDLIRNIDVGNERLFSWKEVITDLR